MSQKQSSLWIFDDEDTRPLPEIVIDKLEGQISFIDTPEGQRLYSVRDWVYYVSSSKNKNLSAPWSDLKKAISKHPEFKVSEILRVLEVETSGGKQAMDFTEEHGLYAITQRMTDRSGMVRAVKRYLSDAGVFTDQVRRKPQTVFTSGAVTPDEVMDAVIEMYHAQGKDDRWIAARLDGKFKRNHFTAALQAAVSEMLKRHHYAMATNQIYVGLWKRTAAYLKKELSLPKSANLRDHQPRLALHYQGIAEEVCAQKLGDRAELSWYEALDIIKMVAEFVGAQAQSTSQLLNMDIATGRPLLPAPL
jgi:hypothetical protein